MAYREAASDLEVDERLLAFIEDEVIAGLDLDPATSWRGPAE